MSPAERIGFFGGTFDPVHVGHVAPVRAARRELELDRVLYLPTAIPPHKTERRLTRASARFAMLELALLDQEGLYVSDHELVLDRPTYTVHSLEHFSREFPGADLVLLVGSDAFTELPSWRRWRDIVSLATVAVLDRPSGGDELVPELRELVEDERAWLLDTPRHAVSGTSLRDRLAAGEEPSSGELAPAVLRYIRKYGLYDEEASAVASD